MALDGGKPVACSFVVTVNELPYIDPVLVAPTHRGTGLGRSMVTASLRSLQDGESTEVGAVITDGNEPSERLFATLHFRRVGSWASGT